MLRAAADHGLAAFCGGMLETGVGRAAALAVAAQPGCALPTDLGPSDRYFRPDLTDPVVVDGRGEVVVPLGPGIGVVPDPARLDDVTVEHVRRATMSRWDLRRQRGDAHGFHQRDLPTGDARELWWFEVERPTLVLGSTQRDDVVDRAAVERGRRRGGPATQRGSGGPAGPR